MEFKELIKSKPFTAALAIFGVLALLLITFGAGVSFGYHRAVFSHRFGENYERNFGRPGPRGFIDNPGMPGHGAAGRIVETASSSLIIADPREGEASIVVTSSTQIRRFNDNLTLADLKAGDFIVVIGSPDEQGRIQARFIRVMPSPPAAPPAPAANSASGTRP